MLLVATMAGCGSGGAQSAASIRSCIEDRLPAGSFDRVFASTEEGVTSLNYFHNGSETDVTIFNSTAPSPKYHEETRRESDPPTVWNVGPAPGIAPFPPDDGSELL